MELKKEKEDLALEVEREEELLTNTLQKKLNQVGSYWPRAEYAGPRSLSRLPSSVSRALLPFVKAVAVCTRVQYRPKPSLQPECRPLFYGRK